ncbi:hypothetical protein D3C87_231110 [compost metagenome]
MKYFLLFFVLFIPILVFSQDEIIYGKARDLIIKSKEYNEFSFGKKDYHISEEIVFFSVFSVFFDVINESTNVTNDEILTINNNLKKLNKKKCGKIKIFYSEIKNNIFFSEVFPYKRKSLKYSKRPTFGSSYVYMFKISEKNEVYIVDVKKIHYN